MLNDINSKIFANIYQTLTSLGNIKSKNFYILPVMASYDYGAKKSLVPSDASIHLFLNMTYSSDDIYKTKKYIPTSFKIGIYFNEDKEGNLSFTFGPTDYFSANILHFIKIPLIAAPNILKHIETVFDIVNSMKDMSDDFISDLNIKEIDDSNELLEVISEYFDIFDLPKNFINISDPSLHPAVILTTSTLKDNNAYSLNISSPQLLETGDNTLLIRVAESGGKMQKVSLGLRLHYPNYVQLQLTKKDTDMINNKINENLKNLSLSNKSLIDNNSKKFKSEITRKLLSVIENILDDNYDKELENIVNDFLNRWRPLSEKCIGHIIDNYEELTNKLDELYKN